MTTEAEHPRYAISQVQIKDGKAYATDGKCAIVVPYEAPPTNVVKDGKVSFPDIEMAMPKTEGRLCIKFNPQLLRIVIDALTVVARNKHKDINLNLWFDPKDATKALRIDAVNAYSPEAEVLATAAIMPLETSSCGDE